MNKLRLLALQRTPRQSHHVRADASHTAGHSGFPQAETTFNWCRAVLRILGAGVGRAGHEAPEPGMTLPAPLSQRPGSQHSSWDSTEIHLVQQWAPFQSCRDSSPDHRQV